jgi:cytoskeletal protein CcmA (bactofilin family)
MWKRDQSVTPVSTPPTVGTAPAQPQGQPIQPIQAVAKPAEKPSMDLGTSVVIKGELSASEDQTLCGHLEGSVRLPEHTLTIGANAEVKAEIVAKTVIILGSVTGNVTATERLDVRATGSVIGDVASPRLVIADGGTLRGKVQMTVGASASHATPLRKVEAAS